MIWMLAGLGIFLILIPFPLRWSGQVILKKTDFVKNFDVVIFPDMEKSVLMEGKYQYKGETILPDYPPEYARGMGLRGRKD